MLRRLITLNHFPRIYLHPKMSSSKVSSNASSLGPQVSRPVQEEPRPQPYYHHNGTSWIPSTSPPSIHTAPAINPKTLRLISWNIDFQQPFGKERMIAALSYLSSLVASAPKETPLVIFLQEMTSSDLILIQESKWIQQRFHITDITPQNWLEPGYGTTTLIDRRLGIKNVFRVPWYSNFSRDGLFVDILLSQSSSPSRGLDGNGDNTNILRLCNTHLESLVATPPIRPFQVSAAAPYLQSATAALIAGDFNAIEPFDRTLHTDNNLKDTYLELGGKEDSDEGYTWGIQVPDWLRERFGCSRMDKILFTGEIEAQGFERVGVDVKVAEEDREDFREMGLTEWVTDHFGVMGDFALSGDLRLNVEWGEEEVKSKLA